MVVNLTSPRLRINPLTTNLLRFRVGKRVDPKFDLMRSKNMTVHSSLFYDEGKRIDVQMSSPYTVGRWMQHCLEITLSKVYSNTNVWTPSVHLTSKVILHLTSPSSPYVSRYPRVSFHPYSLFRQHLVYWRVSFSTTDLRSFILNQCSLLSTRSTCSVWLGFTPPSLDV